MWMGFRTCEQKSDTEILNFHDNIIIFQKLNRELRYIILLVILHKIVVSFKRKTVNTAKKF